MGIGPLLSRESASPYSALPVLCMCSLVCSNKYSKESFKKKKAFIYILIPFNSIFVKKAFKLRSKGSEGLDYGYLGKNISGREIVQGLQAETWLY